MNRSHISFRSWRNCEPYHDSVLDLNESIKVGPIREGDNKHTDVGIATRKESMLRRGYL